MHPLEEMKTCPVSGLTVSRLPQWTNVILAGDYSVSFILIGTRIILTIPKGNAGQYGIRAMDKKRSEFLKEMGLENQKYVEIKDYSFLSGIPSTESRRQTAALIVKEEEKGDLLGYFGFNSGLFIKMAFNIAVKLYHHTFPIKSVPSYKVAMEKALAILEKAGIPADTPPASPHHSHRQPDSHSDFYPAPKQTGSYDDSDTYRQLGEFLSRREVNGEMKELLRFFSEINWDKKGLVVNRDVPDSHIFKPLYDAISLVKFDYDNMSLGKQAAEKEWLVEKSYMEKLFENQYEAIVLGDVDSRVLRVNDTFTRMFGYANAEIVGQHIDQMITPLQYKNEAKEIRAKVMAGKQREVEGQRRRKDGAFIDVSILAAPIIINEERVGSYVIYRDITHRKRTEKMREVLFDISNAASQPINLRSFLALVHDRIATLMDARNFYTALIQDNENDPYVFPYASDENPLEILHNDRPIKITKGLTHYVCRKGKPLLLDETKFQSLIDRGDVIRFGKDSVSWLGVPLRTSDSKIIGAVVVQSYTNPYAYNENDLEVLSIISNTIAGVIKHKKTEEELAEYREHLEKQVEARTIALRQAKDAAEKANKSKGEFLANMSHEIRTPLNAIMGFSELLMNADIGPKEKNFAGLIISETEVLLDLINDLLDISKVEAGKLELESLPFDLRRITDSIHAGMIYRTRSKELDFTITIEKDTQTRLEGDPTRLRQVLVNLIGNAVKFTEKGFVHVLIKLRAETEEHMTLYFEVKDSGIGIPKAKQDQIFESFVQADGSTTRKYGGTGLGTAIARQLVTLLGGEIGLESEPGKGSTFWFTANFKKRYTGTLEEEIQQCAPPILPHVPKKVVPRRRGSILLVEDYPTNREIARVHLQSAGYKVRFAQHGREALDLCEAETFHLILMDLHMPVMDGYEATRQIRSGNTANADLPILAMTANASPQDREGILAAGMNEVITKPIRRSNFLAVVDRFCTKCPKAKSAPGENVTAEPDNINTPQSPTVLMEGPEPIDYLQAVSEFANDKALLNRLLDQFLEKLGQQIPLIRAAADSEDLEIIRNEAHKIKGGAANIVAEPLAAAALHLETMAKSEKKLDPLILNEAVDDLETAYTQLKLFFSTLSNNEPNEV